MKKLLLSISLCAGLCLISCQKDEAENTETTTSPAVVDTNTQKMSATTQVAVQDSTQGKKDSAVQAKTREMKQTNEKGGTKVAISTVPDGKGTKGEGLKSGDPKSAGKDPGKEKGTVTPIPPKGIDHKADEQAKIDSIKKAKGQGKK